MISFSRQECNNGDADDNTKQGEGRKDIINTAKNVNRHYS